ncbi:MAG: PH domain-containing protein [Dysgonamonadaceae bacterium]|nr:PH domain-containing protein [Dysgonamonadaceae bacterium]
MRGFGTHSRRVFGSGGAFGYLGKFNNTELGDCQMYVTDASKKVLIKTSNETLVFSCDKPDEFIHFLRKQKTRNYQK